MQRHADRLLLVALDRHERAQMCREWLGDRAANVWREYRRLDLDKVESIEERSNERDDLRASQRDDTASSEQASEHREHAGPCGERGTYGAFVGWR